MASPDRTGAHGDAERDETPAERNDRKWAELLQELRVMQTGVQLLAGFLLTLPFQQRFASLDQVQRGLYLGLVVLAALTTALVMAPVAVHRRLTGLHIKDRLVRTAHRLVAGVLIGVALLITGMVVFIVDVVLTRPAALGLGALIAAILTGLLLVLPHRLTRE